MQKAEAVCERQSRSVRTGCEDRAGGFYSCGTEEACVGGRCRSLLRGQDPDYAQRRRGLGAVNVCQFLRSAQMNLTTFAEMREVAQQIFRATLSEINLQNVL